ncbi:hypothetical protein scyTo_0016499 [Scyliorhinus torazame]|uniref:Uncharacterized protein n=1 Tax=Scyliorhinus torazame TaxID=75743 RepID=A0A401PS93_SCYTO|nr:hypothetical protein [Scyliorhinus torazame]
MRSAGYLLLCGWFRHSRFAGEASRPLGRVTLRLVLVGARKDPVFSLFFPQVLQDDGQVNTTWSESGGSGHVVRLRCGPRIPFTGQRMQQFSWVRIEDHPRPMEETF